MTEPIKIIRDLDSLQGTCYVEIKPGKYTGEHWTKESIFFTDETFTYFSSAIEKHYKKYSLWGMSEISRVTWKLIVEELENLKLFLMDNPKADELKKHIGFFYLDSTEKKFKENLNQNVSDLVQVISEFQTWITEKCKNNEYISILGI
ncbi:hypothetical protein AS52_03612 [Priestia megaterium Q3]|uniref:Uncharacterized protein n=1 Tax=Priestia megaterium Q3 TaxID=1452722 RepID=A0A806U8Q2_PRIMG|nr:MULTISPECIES: hypothetical protein [Priestia]AKP78573.1 hypothetical protein AS52_03612 [Priestia megaterium Q3]MED4014274.1 hypothetical protein [Priestia aryabhattai]